MKKNFYVEIGVVILLVIILAIIFFGGNKTNSGENSLEKINPTGEIKEFSIIAQQWSFIPSEIRVNAGDRVRLKIKSIDVNHGFSLPEFGINEYLSPGKEIIIEFLADKKGEFSFFCNIYCGSGHGRMVGSLIVE